MPSEQRGCLRYRYLTVRDGSRVFVARRLSFQRVGSLVSERVDLMKNKTKRAILHQGLASLVLVLAVSCIENPSAVAQQSVTSATLSGRIVDAGGASVSGATLSATSLETNQKQGARDVLKSNEYR